MKSIITFALAVLATLSSQAAVNPGLSELDSDFGYGIGVRFQSKFVNEDFVPNPATFVSSGYLKPVEKAATDNKQIIDAQEEVYAPLYLETPVAQINENNRVTEAKLSAYAPLDFNYINKKQEKIRIPSCLPKL